MKSFDDKIAVITGGGTGMGRELALQLSAAGCHVAICDVSEENMARTRELSLQQAHGEIRVTSFVADVSDEQQLVAFRDAVMTEHETDCIHLLFNNAGIGGGGSFVLDGREEWERTFDICWRGVYYGSRVFLPLLLASEEGHLINTSSINGFWASLGPNSAHTAYSAAKFAVKGFSEALVNDLKLNAPHVKVSLVMPGHVGTSIVINSGRVLGREPKELSDEDLERARERMVLQGLDVGSLGLEELRQAMIAVSEAFRDNALTTAAEAAKIILDGVREERWRILVGPDAEVLDQLVRESPEEAYGQEFMDRFQSRTTWFLGG